MRFFISHIILQLQTSDFSLQYMRVINNNNQKGFTLIELLVVISIIGILSALLMSNFTSIRERARDTQRKSDLKQIQKALEMYKNSQTVLQYPQTNDWDTMRDALVNGNYMKKIPDDPVNTSPLVYTYISPVETDTLRYTLKACLENASDKDGVDDVTCTSGKKFELTEP